GELRLLDLETIDLFDRGVDRRIEQLVVRVRRETSYPDVAFALAEDEMVDHLARGQIDHLDAVVPGGRVDLLLVVREREGLRRARVELDLIDDFSRRLVNQQDLARPCAHVEYAASFLGRRRRNHEGHEEPGEKKKGE